MISIIIPVHNVSEFICPCIESIASQTYKDLEVLLIDDCGKDDSVEKAQGFIDEYSGPILFRIIHHPHNKGVSAARNTGIAAATGEFISFVDSDDYLDPDFCRILLSYMQNGTPEVGVVACGIFKDSSGCIQDYYKVESLHVIPPDLYVKEMFVSGGAPFWAWGKMFKKEILQNVTFREERRIEDTLFAFDVYPYIESNGINTLVIPEQLYYYRFHQSNYCNGDKIFLDALESYEEMLRMVDKRRSDLVLCNT